MQIGEQIDRAADYADDYLGAIVRWLLIVGVTALVMAGLFVAATSFAPAPGPVSDTAR